MIEINQTNQLNELILNNKIVLVDFYASWCGPCQEASPSVKKAEKEMGDKIKFCGVDVDEEGDLLEKFRIVSIPVMLLFFNGKLVERWEGKDCLSVYEKLELVLANNS